MPPTGNVTVVHEAAGGGAAHGGEGVTGSTQPAERGGRAEGSASKDPVVQVRRTDSSQKDVGMTRRKTKGHHQAPTKIQGACKQKLRIFSHSDCVVFVLLFFYFFLVLREAADCWIACCVLWHCV